MRQVLYLIIFSLSVLTNPVWAWSPLGHMVVADIAYEHLTPNARAKVDEMVIILQREYPNIDSFAKMAYWADAIRMQRVETYTHWHYADYAISTDKSPLKNLMDTDNAIWAIPRLERVVKYPKANPYERARFLAFLVHIVGDIHQPLHTVSNITALHPDGDQGGNLVWVRYQNKRTKLHRLWDQGVGAFAGDMSVARADSLAAAIMLRYPEQSFGKAVADLEPTDWAKEGVNLAKQYVYTTPENQALSEKYLEIGKHIAEQQTALAGYRLAHLLNNLLT